jgi:hypothetical protein
MSVIYWVSIWLRRLVVGLVLVAIALAAPVLYTEYRCTGTPIGAAEAALLPEGQRRDESRTFTTYPEWHIVHAYDDYARVIATDDPHGFGYFAAIRGFWSSLCPLAAKAAAHGGFTTESKQTIYTIGASFTLEMALKGLYEETAGRLATLVRGQQRAPLDDLSARQAADYAAFLTQTPWYMWDFGADADALWAARTDAPRDWERAVALTIEYRGKALYAGLIRRAVAAVGEDALTLRSVVSGLDADALAGIEGVTVVGPRGEGLEIETPRYRAFTLILKEIAARGGRMTEIAGNDDILLTAISPEPTTGGALYSFPRQGHGDWRHLIETRVPDLTERIRAIEAAGARVEHVHDY